MLKIEKDKVKAEKIAKEKSEIMIKRALIRKRAEEEKAKKCLKDI